MLCCSTGLLHAQTTQVFFGRTITSSTAEIVQLASIQNLTNGKRAISNRQGYFKIQASLTDTILFTSVGYDSLKFQLSFVCDAISDDTIVIFMKSKVVKLKEVRIVTSNPKRDSLARAAAEFLKNDPLMNNNDRILKRDKGGLMNPITAMYEQFSKAGRDMAKFEEFVAYMEVQKMVDKRYNRNVVLRVTTISELRVDEFMRFCKLDKQFILESDDYHLIKAIKDCEANFRTQN